MPNYVMFNIKMVKGDTESFGFEIEGVENLDAAYFSCKRNSQDENYLFQKSLNSGITQKTENQYVVRIEPDDTALLEPGQYWYDLEISKNDDVFTIFRGVLELLPEITTPTGDININTSWGRITGNINNQEDLQLEFQTKADVSSLSTVATTGLYSDLTGTPNLATVATTGSYNDLLNKPSIPTKTSDLTNDSNFVASTSLATVATTGAYSDLTGTPNLATVATSGSYADLTNKPNLAAVATTGDYSDLSGTPNLATVATSGSYADLSNKPNLSTVATSGLYSDLTGAPNLATVATSGSYIDLTNKPNLSTVATTGDYSDLSNKPNLATVATSGSYNDLLNKPSIPTKTSDLTNDSNFVASTSLATVATSGAYSDLTGTPNLATVATSGSYADLSNTPNLATVATTGDYSDLTGTPNLATVATSGLITDLSGVLPLTNGGTGATNASDAQTNIGLTREIAFESTSGSSVVNIDYYAPGSTVKIGVLYSLYNESSSYGVQTFYNEFFPKKSGGTVGYTLPAVGLSSLAQQSSNPYIYFNNVHFPLSYQTKTQDFRFGYITGSYPSFKLSLNNGILEGSKDANIIVRIFKIIVYSY